MLKPFEKNDSRINRNGRPPKSLKLEKLIDQHCDMAEVVQVLYSKALKGNLHAIELLLSHRYGKPKVRVYQETEISGTPSIQWDCLSEPTLKEILKHTTIDDDES